MAKESFQIIKHLQTITVMADGLTRELNLITLDNDRERLHIGDWKTDKQGRKRPAGPGLVLTMAEADRLSNGLWNYTFAEVMAHRPNAMTADEIQQVLQRVAASNEQRDRKAAEDAARK